MKYFLLIYLTGILLVISPKVTAQISLENSYNHNGYFKTSTLTNGNICQSIVDNNILYVYDSNHNLITSFPLYVPSVHLLELENYFISDNLFNLDNLIEILYTTYDPFGLTPDSTFIVNSSTNIANLAGRFGYCYKSGNDFKLNLWRRQPGNKGNDVYTLPGTYPCDPCSNLSGIATPKDGSVQRISTAFPNPTSIPVTITYRLPDGITNAEIKVTDLQGRNIVRYRIGKDSDAITIPTENLASGQYRYAIHCAGQIIEGGGFSVVK